MKKKFYDHIVTLEEIHTELDTLSLSEDEKHHLKLLAHSTVHQVVLDIVLSELSDEDKTAFLDHLEKNDHETIWQFLKKKITGIEQKISTVATTVQDELKRDIAALKPS